MSETTPVKLRDAAIASELVTVNEMEQCLAALAKVRAEHGWSEAEAGDDQLADQLIEKRLVTPWQIEQLKKGRTRFTLGPYRIVDAIAVGGMGQVFKGEHAMMGRTVAVKVLPKDKTTPESIESFEHEVRAQARLDHPNLVRAYDAGHDGDVYYLVTEYVPGSDLRRLVRQMGRLSQRDAATILSQVASGLQHVHEMGLVHRDTKPGNVLVTKEGRAKLSDLGLAGFLVGEWEENDPRAGKIVGTADYLAPEQIISPHDVSPSCDIYGLGCTMYYAVTGKVPFPGGTNKEKCHRHCNEVPLNPRRFHPDLSPEFVEVMADMLEKDPKKRISSAGEVVWRLSPWIDEGAYGTDNPDDDRWAEIELAKLESSQSSAYTPEDLSELIENAEQPLTLAPRQGDSQSTEQIVAAAQETAALEAAGLLPPALPPEFVTTRPAERERSFSMGQVLAIVAVATALTALVTGTLVALLL